MPKSLGLKTQEIYINNFINCSHLILKEESIMLKKI